MCNPSMPLGKGSCLLSAGSLIENIIAAAGGLSFNLSDITNVTIGKLKNGSGHVETLKKHCLVRVCKVEVIKLQLIGKPIGLEPLNTIITFSKCFFPRCNQA